MLRRKEKCRCRRSRKSRACISPRELPTSLPRSLKKTKFFREAQILMSKWIKKIISRRKESMKPNKEASKNANLDNFQTRHCSRKTVRQTPSVFWAVCTRRRYISNPDNRSQIPRNKFTICMKGTAVKNNGKLKQASGMSWSHANPPMASSIHV